MPVSWCKTARITPLLVILVLILSACGPEASPEQQVRDTLAALEAAVEKRSLGAVGDFIADDYADTWHVDRNTVLRSLLAYLQGHQSIHLLTRVAEIQLDDASQQALAVVFVGMAGVPVESPQALLTLNADLYRFEIGLRRDASDWQIIKASWRPAMIDDF